MAGGSADFLVGGLAFALVAVAGLFGLDAVVAQWTAGLSDGGTLWDWGTALLDLIALKEISTFLLGALLIVAAGLLLVIRAMRGPGWLLLYVGLVQFATTTVADLSKPQFGRLRPYEAMAGPGGMDSWFVGANSFPSGHTAFYAGLFFPLMLLFPRWAPLLAIAPLFIAAARVLEHDHYLSDVSVSLALAAALTAAFSAIARKGHRLAPPRHV